MKIYKDVTMKVLLSFLMVVLGFGSSAFAAPAGFPSGATGGPNVGIAGQGPVVLYDPETGVGNGFPLWYSDTVGNVVQPCLDRFDPLCEIISGDIEPPDSTGQIHFPDIFPGEPMYWIGENQFFFTALRGPTAGTQVKAKLIQRLEMGFINDVIVDGDQWAFTRVKIVIPGLIAGAEYTITYPYGKFPVTAILVNDGGTVTTDDDEGKINLVEDIPIFTAGGGFTEGSGNVGPLLQWVDPSTGLPNPPTGYLGDPLADHVVTGSPFDTNFFRIEGPGLPHSCPDFPGTACIENDTFAIIGKRVGDPLQNVQITDSAGLPLDKSVPFGPQLVNGTSVTTHTITITNTSQGNFAIDAGVGGGVFTLDQLTAPFSFLPEPDTNCISATIVPPGMAGAGASQESCKFTIAFDPTVTGAFTQTFDIHLHDFPDLLPDVCAGDPVVCVPAPLPTPATRVITVTVSGTGAVPDIAVIDQGNPGNFDPLTGNLSVMSFTPITEGTSSERVIQVTNNGLVALHVFSVDQNNPGTSDFSILEGSDTCSGPLGTVTQGASCNFTIQFSPPTAETVSSETFTISSDSPGEETVSFDVTGSATSAAAPIIHADTNSLSYGDVTINTSSDRSVTISNIGNDDLHINGLSGGPLVPYSLVSDGCSGAVLGTDFVNDTCTITVRYLADVLGDTSPASFDVNSDGGTVTVDLSGSGVAVPVPNISIQDAGDRDILFGNVTAGRTVTHTVDVTNTGNATLTLGLFGNSLDANPLVAPYSLGFNTCVNASLAPGESCHFDVLFAPEGPGNVVDAVVIPSNDPDQPQLTVDVSGTGLAALVNNAPSPFLKVAPADAQPGVGTSPVVSWQASSDPEGETVSYTVRYCENHAMTTGCNEVDIPAIVASAITKAAKSISFAELGLGTGMVFGIILIGGADRRRRFGMFVAAMIVSGALLSSCSGGGSSHDIQSAGGSAFASDLSVTLPGLEQGKTYYWKVIAKDGTGNETTTSIWKFTT